MGSNSTRVPKVLVSNAQAANTGTSATTAVNNDVIIIDRTGAQLPDGATLQANAAADVIRIILGKGAASATSPNIEYSFPIQVKNVRKVTTQLYEAPVQHTVTVDCTKATLAANTTYTAKVILHENHKIALHGSEQVFTYVSGAAVPTATDVAAGIVAAVNANKGAKVTATNAAGTITFTGKAASGTNATELNNYMFQYFHVALRAGFTQANAAAALGGTPGKQGKGAGKQVQDMERFSTASFYRDYTSFPNQNMLEGSPLRAVTATPYNLVVIEHSTEQTGDLTQTFKAPQTTIVAFAAADSVTNTAPYTSGAVGVSAKQAAFMTKLSSIIESGGVFVS